MTEAVLFGFELDGKGLHRAPLEARKRELAKLLRKAGWAPYFNEHIDEPGDVVFRTPASSVLRASCRNG